MKAKWTVAVGVVALQVVFTAAIVSPAAQAAAWRTLTTTGLGPSERSTPAVGALDAAIYVFGGVKDDFSTQLNTFYDDLHRFDTATNTWERLSPRGEPPAARAFAGNAVHRGRRLFLVFGGATFGPLFVGFEAHDDLWAYDVDANEWREIVAANPGPSGRSRPNAWIDGDRLYIFGGITATFTTLNDLWLYDFATNSWSELIPNGDPGAPPPRHEGMAGTRPVSGALTVYGGEHFDPLRGFLTLADTWQHDLATATWTDVTPPPAQDIQPPRNYAAAAVIGQFLYVIGGDLPGGTSGCGAPFPQNPTNEIWKFHLNQHVWSQVIPAGDPVPRLKRTNAAVANGVVYVLSGWDFVCPPGQIWNLEVHTFDPRG
jgi:N-acetylneuraminic acid mutarotase